MDKRHLIERCQSGDREAFGILYQTYLVPMYEIVAYYVHDHDAVWDILHDGFLIAFSHKEIAALLGIAPHSSSSQLTHAKAMLRRMITQYRMEMGLLSIIGIIMLIWHWAINRREETPLTPVISSNTDKEIPFVTDSIEGADSAIDSIVPTSKRIDKAIQHSETQQNIAEITVTSDSIPAIKNDSIANDTVRVFQNIVNREELIAQENFPNTQHAENPNWSLCLVLKNLD